METLAGVIVGAFLTYWVSIRLAQRERKLNIDLERIRALESQKALITILEEEIQVLWNLLDSDVGTVLRATPGEKVFARGMVYEQDYMLVFKSTCGQLGIIEDIYVRRAVSGFYGAARTFIDELHINSRMLEDFVASEQGKGNRPLFNIQEGLVSKRRTIEEFHGFLGTNFSRLQELVPKYLALVEAEIKTIRLGHRNSKSWIDEMCSED